MRFVALVFMCVLMVTATPAHDPILSVSGIRTFTPEYSAEYDYVSISGYYFNPRQGLPEIPANLKGSSNYYLIHLKGPVYDYMKSQIENFGVKLIQYIPFNAFIVRMEENQKSGIEALPFVNWVGTYEPAYKISPLFSEGGRKTIYVQLFNDEDINSVATDLKKMGGSILEISVTEYNKIVLADIDLANLSKIAQLPQVMYIEPWSKPVLVNENAQWVTQTWQVGNRRLWRKGVDGQGQVVNTADTGILMGAVSHDMFRDPAVAINTWGDFPTHRKIIAYRTWVGSSAAFGDVAAASWHGTHTAGTISGDDSYVSGTDACDGMPLKAKMFFMDVGTAAGGLSIPADLTDLYTLPYNGNAGGAARVSSHSWGYTSGAGSYTINCSQTDQFMWNNKAFLICYAAGNNGPNPTTVIPPGTSKDIITAGAVANATSATQVATFSSRGPCLDTRYKPSVTAPGQSMRSSVGPNATSYGFMDGTSMATPCIAGNAALVRNYFAKGFYPTGDSVVGNRWAYISAAVVKACIINGAAPDVLGSTIPDNNTGWGRVNLDAALYFTNDVRKLAAYDDTLGLSTGQFREYTVTVNNQSEPLKVALVWTDYFGAGGANPAIVNNLDLLVTGPNSVYYRGNQYTGGQSTPNPGTWDNRNVEECVRRNVPEIGTWTVRVTGTNVPSGTRQAFAVVISGGLGLTTQPVLHISGRRIDDPAPGNNNSRVDPGETVWLTDTLKNLSNVGVTACTGRLRLGQPSAYITLIDTVGTFGDIAVGGSGHNGASRFRFSASATTPPGTVIDFVLALSGGGGFSQTIPFDIMIGSSGVMIIWGPKPLPSFPTGGFPYGLAYNPTNQRIYVTDAYGRSIYVYSGDSNVTYIGTIPAPDTLCTDIKYCSYDNTFWVAANPTVRRVCKISATGTILRQFNNPANDYPTGLAWVERDRQLFLADRRTAQNTFPQYIYVSDTLGTTIRRMDEVLRGNVGPRCLAFEPAGPGLGTLLHIYTTFNTGGTAIDSIGLYELRRADATIVQRILMPGWNARGVEYDPRDGNYWITIVQSPDRSVVKIAGFYGPMNMVEEQLGGNLIANALYLFPAQPNPCKGKVKISYQLPAKTKVKLNVFDASGRMATTLINRTELAGLKTVVWNGKTREGSQIASGVYFYQLETKGTTLIRKLVYTR